MSARGRRQLERVPNGAELEDSYSGTVKAGPHAGRDATVKLFKGAASDGRATDYKRRPARWLAIFVDGVPEKVSRYSGRRYDVAREHFSEGRELVE